MKERDKQTAIEALWQLSKAVRYEVNDPGKNLETAKNHLKTGSLLLYTNHFSRLDTTVLARFIERHMNFQNLSIVAARKYLDKERGGLSIFTSRVIPDFSRSRGFRVLQVVQRKEMEIYGDAEQFNRVSMKRAVLSIQEPGQIVAIAPEGTRSNAGTLLKAQDGLDKLFRLGKNTLALPIAMHPYKIVPPFTKTTVEIGAPFSYREIEIEKELYPELSITDLMMRRLAVLLPQENRGYYSTL